MANINIDQSKARESALSLLKTVADIGSRLTGVLPKEDGLQRKAALAATVFELFSNQEVLSVDLKPRLPAYWESFRPGEHSGFRVDYTSRRDEALLYAHGGMRDISAGVDLQDSTSSAIKGRSHSGRTDDICSSCTGIDVRVQNSSPRKGSQLKVDMHLVPYPGDRIEMTGLTLNNEKIDRGLSLRNGMSGFEDLQSKITAASNLLSSMVPNLRYEERRVRDR